MSLLFIGLIEGILFLCALWILLPCRLCLVRLFYQRLAVEYLRKSPISSRFSFPLFFVSVSTESPNISTFLIASIFAFAIFPLLPFSYCLSSFLRFSQVLSCLQQLPLRRIIFCSVHDLALSCFYKLCVATLLYSIVVYMSIDFFKNVALPHFLMYSITRR